MSVVGRVQQMLVALDLPTTHLAGIGGWNAPHPDTSFTGEQWFQVNGDYLVVLKP